MITNEVFNQLCEDLARHRTKEKDGKHPSYTHGSKNRLQNFDAIAERSLGGLTPEQVLYVYMTKHYDAVVSALLQPDLPQGEALIGRIGDLVNYLELAYAMIERRELKKKGQAPIVGDPAPVGGLALLAMRSASR